MKMRFFCKTLSLGVFLLCLIGQESFASTNYVRELAKNKPSIYLITSGSQAEEEALILQTAILRHQDDKHKPETVRIVGIEDAAKQSKEDAKFGSATLVFLLISREYPKALPVELSASFQFSPVDPDSSESLIKAERTRGAKAGLAFNILLEAPDQERLKRLTGIFLNRTADKFDSLPFEAVYRTNRIALFCDPQDRELLEGWGELRDPTVWNDVERYSLSERNTMTPEQLSERAEVYFLDRSRPDAVMPAPAERILEKNKDRLSETSILVAQEETEDHRPIALISAPTHLVLQKKISRYSDMEALKSAPALEEITDLRTIGSTTLLIGGISVPDEDKEALRSRIAKDLRSDLRLDVQERGPNLRVLEKELTLQKLMGDTASAKDMRRDVGLKYVWLFDLQEYGGVTNYESGYNQITPNPSAFSEPEPERPSEYAGPLFHKKKREPQVMADLLAKWRNSHNRWLQDKQDYEEKMAASYFEFERTSEAVSSARVRGTLRLMDLRGVGKVVWEKECSLDQSSRTPYRSDRVTVRGVGNRPDSLDTPPSSNTCPSNLLVETAYEAGKKALSDLQESAWLPDGTQPASPVAIDPPPVVASGPSPAKPPISPNEGGPKVAAVVDGVVILAAGRQRGLYVGDRVTIPLVFKEIRDPDNEDRILRIIVQESIRLKVVKVDRLTADCAPLNATEAAKLSKVQPKMAVQWQHVPPLPKATANPKPLHPTVTPKTRAKRGKRTLHRSKRL
jgi:hypothetical protein